MTVTELKNMTLTELSMEDQTETFGGGLFLAAVAAGVATYYLCSFIDGVYTGMKQELNK